MLAVSEWAAANTLIVLGADLPTKAIWSKVQFVGLALTPLAWLVFAAQYTGRAGWITVGAIVETCGNWSPA